MTKSWTQEQIKYIQTHYPDQGAVPVAKALGYTAKAVHVKAQRLGIRVTKLAMHRIVHDRAAEHMRNNNPMHNPKSLQKAKQTRLDDPETSQRVHAALMQGQQRLQQSKTSNLELKLQLILKELGVIYESTVLIKPKFIVDIRIGSLIIQADGDYWHGHSRYGVLTLRQQRQRQRDDAQTAYLNACGYTVARIWESELSRDAVIQVLVSHGIMHSDD